MNFDLSRADWTENVSFIKSLLTYALLISTYRFELNKGERANTPHITVCAHALSDVAFHNNVCRCSYIILERTLVISSSPSH